MPAYYTPSGKPLNETRGLAAEMRAEFQRIESGFALIPESIALNPGLSATPIYLRSLAALDETRITTGTYAGGYLVAPNGYLNVYFACMGLIPAVADRPVEVKAFLDMVLAQLVVASDGARGSYVIYDVLNPTTTPTLKDPDSNDSYAALLNWLAYTYANTTGDWVWYSANIAKLKDIAYYNNVIPVKPGGAAGAGMCRTFQTAAWGTYYGICLTEDNSEVYAGLNALSLGLAQIGLAADATYYASARDTIGLGMHNVTYGVWDSLNGRWFVSDQRPAFAGNFYADAVTQIFPELNGVSSGAPATDRQRFDMGWASLNQIAPQWPTTQYDSFPWLMLGRVACLRGAYAMAETQIDYALRTRTRDKFTASELGHLRAMELAFIARGAAALAPVPVSVNGSLVYTPVTGVSQTAIAGGAYSLQNALATTVTLPAFVEGAAAVVVKPANELETNKIDPGAGAIEGNTGLLVLDNPFRIYTLQPLNGKWRFA